MIRIDDSLLEELGLIALPKQDRDQLLNQIYETLEMRVGMRLAERMSDQQLDEFEKFIDTNDETSALKWLETNFPDYKQVVADELEKLKTEIKQDSTKIFDAMQTNTTAPTDVPAPVPDPTPMPPPPAPAQTWQQPSPVNNDDAFGGQATDSQSHVPPPPPSFPDSSQQPPMAA